ncbi:MAG: TolC family protein [Planctomycetota bacterium]|nr:TolC family protein [Planctomycetota bacterium]
MHQATVEPKRSLPRGRLAVVGALLALAGCVAPFKKDDYLAYRPPPGQLAEIDTVKLEEQSLTDPVSVEEATAGEAIETARQPPAPPETMDLTLEQVRAAVLGNNLDLQVELVNPTITQTSVDEEEAKFEAAFSGSAFHSRTDSPTALGTEGTMSEFSSVDLGVDIPLRSGGSARVSFPATKTKTNNPFALLDPSYTTDFRFSLSHPLLRGAGQRVNTHSIRVARHQHQITTARTKLEAIRILANADRAYWSLYAAQRALEVRQQEYELAVRQMERARRQYDAGAVAEIEIVRAEAGVADRLEAIIIAQTTIRRRQRDLKRLMNRDDLPMNSPTEIALTSEPDPMGLELDPVALSDYALANRMEMLELEIQLAIDASTVDFQRNAKLPLVTLDYNYTINGLGPSARDAFDQLPDKSFEDWSLGVSAEIPLGNEAAEAGYHRAILQRVQRLATKEQRIAAIRQEVHDAVDQLQQNWQRILAARQAALLAGRTYEAEQRQFDVGASTSTDVLDAAARLSDAQLREIQALTDYEIAQVDIAFATGTLLGYGRIRWEPIGLSDVR